jgi:hypothetical protein
MRLQALLAVFLVAACRGGVTKSKEAPMTTTPNKQILFYDGDKLIKTENAADVPDQARYVVVDGQRVEVAKVVRKDAPDGRQAIEQYAADGKLLSRTLMLPSPEGKATR